MNAALMSRPAELQEENRQLKKMSAEERLKTDIIQETSAKKCRGHLANARRPEPRWTCPSNSLTPPSASAKVATAASTSPRRRMPRSPIFLIRMTHNQCKWGLRPCLLYMPNVKDHLLASQARISDLLRTGTEFADRAEETDRSGKTGVLGGTDAYQRRLIDGLYIIYEELNNGRTYLLFNVIDDFNREGACHRSSGYHCLPRGSFEHLKRWSVAQVTVATTNRNISMAASAIGRSNETSAPSISSPASRSRTSILSATTEPCDMTGWDSAC